jgi:hypothetical protein
VLRQMFGQPLQGPEVTGTEIYLQEAGVLCKEAGHLHQSSEVVRTETCLKEAGVLRQEGWSAQTRGLPTEPRPRSGP